ncbi:MAG: DUF6851 domain-containing protein, partial [Phycisphaerales bacterium]
MKIRTSISALLALVGATAAGPLASSASAESVARVWNEQLLTSIRNDLVRPPVQARNLFHVSVAMYDAWAAYQPGQRGYFFAEKISAPDIEAARREAISYAAFRMMKHRFAVSPNYATIISPALDARMVALGYDPANTSTSGNSPSAVGNRVAALVIQRTVNDGSREAFNHATASGTYLDVNPALVVALPFNPSVVNPSRYQPLALS